MGRARLGLLASLAVLTAAAWALTLYQMLAMSMPMGIAARDGASADAMKGMDMTGMDMAGMKMAGMKMAGMAAAGMPAGGWSLTGAGVFLVVWTVMMAAMMLPAAAPMILVFAGAQARRQRGVALPTWIFVAGYILVWAAAGLAVYLLVQLGSDVATSLAPANRALWAPLALGATLVVAGFYQFTPLKRVCLNHCRSPLAFVAQHWRDGWGGALSMGLRHGAYCLGCCWVLFAVLVATGVMSLAWMLLLTLVVFAEKLFPYGGRAAAIIGAALIALGLLVAAGGVPMPWMA